MTVVRVGESELYLHLIPQQIIEGFTLPDKIVPAFVYDYFREVKVRSTMLFSS